MRGGAEDKKADNGALDAVKRAIAFVEARNYQVVPFGGPPSRRAQILWRMSGSMITPGGMKCEPEENELDLSFDMPMLVSDCKREFPDARDPVQRGHRIEAIHPETKSPR